jgi:uncharacterized membrane protein
MVQMSEDLKRAVTIFISTTIVFSMLAYVVVTPRPKEQFFQIYVLGDGGKAERYYPGNDPNIPVGRMVTWHVGATNFMSSVQYVVLRMKLGNSTIKAPDDTNHFPSPAPVLLEFKRVLMNNETWEFPVVWRMREIRVNGTVVTPVVLEVNGVGIRNSDVNALKGYNFRLFFELWTFDPENGAVIFGWKTGAERRVAWLQIWFNATGPIPG